MATAWTDNVTQLLEPDELDAVRQAIVEILVRDTEMSMEAAYSLVFREGGHITWH